MLFEANLQKSFWAEAVSTAVYLINRSPTRGHGMTPEDMYAVNQLSRYNSNPGVQLSRGAASANQQLPYRHCEEEYRGGQDSLHNSERQVQDPSTATTRAPLRLLRTVDTTLGSSTSTSVTITYGMRWNEK